MPLQGSGELFDSARLLRARHCNAIPRAAITVEVRPLDRLEIGFVEHEERLEIGKLCGDQIMVDDEPIGRRRRGDDDGELRKVRRNQLATAAAVHSCQRSAPLQDARDGAGAVQLAPPFDIVRDDGLEAPLRALAEISPAVCGLNGHVTSMACDDDPARCHRPRALRRTLRARPAISPRRAAGAGTMRVSEEYELNRRSNLIWIDLEMTGLNPDSDRIIEIATVVTDKDLIVLDEGPVCAIHQPDAVLDAMDEWNTRQHNQSGLVERVRNSSVTEHEAEQQTLSFLRRYVEHGSSPMCGNSICQDRRFLVRNMSELAAFFHYRNLDVSSFKIVTQLWAPEVAAHFEKQSTHLALADIHDSIRELRFYREHIMKIGSR